ncbi:hypothetical protein BKA62DRAFT_685899 [Auriculariales sp. MPI-PUGE-AT-0066]|nr:hypothetical protein BKA62DRAFT_685899 [Auriculariales sp. MPI-PUGE-AT-0066]
MTAPESPAPAMNSSPKHSPSRAGASSPTVDKEKDMKKPHVCPPSTAATPRDRWETAFVYAFVKRFIENERDPKSYIFGLETPGDLEEALLSSQPEPALEQILMRFVKNLKTKKGSINLETISHHVSQIVTEYLSGSERSIFWNEELSCNVNPLAEVGFFSAHWDVKLRVLRQLVEWQLTFYAPVKQSIDRAWGVTHNLHRKTAQEIAAERVPDEDPFSKKSLLMVPIGQDYSKRRYWVVDNSPRLYVSTNPWKLSAGFETVANTVAEYTDAIEKLRGEAPANPPSQAKAKKWYENHNQLIADLEARVVAIEQELARVERARAKAVRDARMQQQAAEFRVTRSRRQPNSNERGTYEEPPSDDDASNEEVDGGDDYRQGRDDDSEDDDAAAAIEADDMSVASGSAPRRSRRAATKASTNGTKRTRNVAQDVAIWQTEARRSTRQIAAALNAAETPEPSSEVSLRPRKKRRMSESPPIELPANGGTYPVLARQKRKIGENEKVVDQLAGRKKSKFWAYAIEVPQSADDAHSDANDEAAIQDEPVDGDLEDDESAVKHKPTSNGATATHETASDDDSPNGKLNGQYTSVASSRTSDAMDISDEDK